MTTRRDLLKYSALAAASAALPSFAAAQAAMAGVPKADKPLNILILGGTGFTGPFQVAYALARETGYTTAVTTIDGIDVAVAICEDLWQDGGPVAWTREAGTPVLAVLNASPYERDKDDVRLALCQQPAGALHCGLAGRGQRHVHGLGIGLAAANPMTGVVHPANTGTAQVSASVNDPAALMASDYEMRFSAGSVSVVRLSDGDSTSFAVPPTAFNKDGLTFNIDSGAAAAGDRILIRPFEAAARNLQVAIGSPDRLAAASPVMVTPGTGNSGGLSVESLYASSASANLTDPVTITFNADGSFSATGLGPGNPPPDNAGPPPSYNFKPGQAIVLNGWSLTLRGNPTAGDSFSIGASPSNAIAQSAGNASGMLALRDLATFDGVPLSDGYVSLFSDLGTRVQGAQFAADFSAGVATAAEQARSNVAGVNLDEEAARLLQFQQAYQASAKFLQIAQSTFDSLLQTVGR